MTRTVSAENAAKRRELTEAGWIAAQWHRGDTK